ncbi:MAG TPA: peroxiredoxin [Opitutaceae bacterium]|nr:peroxiredoxin [Opitutaceae bacterium]
MKRLLVLATMILSLLGLRAAAEPLEVGAAVPAVVAPTDAGSTLDLAQAGKAGFLLVYFYPKADTPGCTAQGCSLRDAYADLTAKGVQVVGVSTDEVEAQKAFREKYHLPFPLIADSEKKVTAAFGVPTTMGFAARQAFLFKDGKLVWRNLKAPTAQQAAEVLEALKTL